MKSHFTKLIRKGNNLWLLIYKSRRHMKKSSAQNSFFLSYLVKTYTVLQRRKNCQKYLRRKVKTLKLRTTNVKTALMLGSKHTYIPFWIFY